MDVYLDRQAQQLNRAKTFAEIGQIESRMAQARPEARRRAPWPFGALAARRRRTAGALPCPVTR